VTLIKSMSKSPLYCDLLYRKLLRCLLQVYRAVRAGKLEEAAGAADAHALALPTMYAVAENLRDWLSQWTASRPRALQERTTRTIRQHAEALLQAGELAECSSATARAVLIVLSVLCSSSTPLDAAVQGQVPALAQGGLESIEDWLWFHCTICGTKAVAGAIFT
jgi:hypothetical protein